MFRVLCQGITAREQVYFGRGHGRQSPQIHIASILSHVHGITSTTPLT